MEVDRTCIDPDKASEYYTKYCGIEAKNIAANREQRTALPPVISAAVH